MRVVLTSALAALVGGCVFPTDDPTGLELSWRFLEVNEVDGEEGQRDRTCDGVDVERIVLEIADLDEADRHGTFRFDCEAGYQTVQEFQTQASDAFLELRPGDYRVTLAGIFAPGGQEVLITRDVDVTGRGLTVEVFELARETTAWELAVQGADACTELSLALLYADPATTLAEPPVDEDDEVVPTIYRENLVTDRGLALGGQTTACAAELDGVHVIDGIDPGAYRLELTVDGQPCAIGVGIAADTSTPIDLANLPCQG